jgi:pimeloyl-ACP methyl ester carboxylesterase
MRSVEHQDVKLITETFGHASDPAMLLLMGATASMFGWPDEFCVALAERGLYVIRYDHRDTGQSTTVPPGSAKYALEDMADDAIAIIDAYNLDYAHLTGMSLGGLIAQMVAVTLPERIASVTLIASEPLGWDGEALPHISQEFLDHFGALGSLDWSDHKAVTDFLVESQRLCAGTGAPFELDREKARVERVLMRTNSIASMFNHGALTTRNDWTGRFREIACPVLVVHGEQDPILPIQNGKAITDGIPGATLLILEKVGHELPLTKITDIADRIAVHSRVLQI